MDKTTQYLTKVCDLWTLHVNLGIEYNTGINLGIDDQTAELLTCMEENILGTGGSSYGYDHNNQDETKVSCWVQPKKCCDCSKKIHFFSKSCVCGSKNFEFINDSRWGIDTQAHFLYKVQNYHLWVFEPETYDSDVKTFSLKRFLISSENKFFNDILKVQLNSGKTKNKNFIPYSADFFVSNPKMLSNFKIHKDENFGFIVERQNNEEILFTNEIIKKIKPYLKNDFKKNKDTYHYNELVDYLDIFAKKTSHGKERGKTSRRI